MYNSDYMAVVIRADCPEVTSEMTLAREKKKLKEN